MVQHADAHDRVVLSLRDPGSRFDIADDDLRAVAGARTRELRCRRAEVDRHELAAGIGEQRCERSGAATELEADRAGSETGGGDDAVRAAGGA